MMAVRWAAAAMVLWLACVQGPPAQAGQSLTPYQLEIEGKSIYALVESA